MSGAALLLKKCCCADRGCFCLNDTTTAVITITGSCSDESSCDDGEGTYPVNLHADAPCECYYSWQLGGTLWDLLLRYCRDEERWVAFLTNGLVENYGDGAAAPECCSKTWTWFKDITGDITCSAGKIIASFTLEGINGISDCSGCTATVTIG